MKIEDFITPTQEELFAKLNRMYKENSVAKPGSYLLVKGDAPIMLLAHMDTVHKEQVKYICSTQDGNILMSPQGIGGDDRCGIFALVAVRKKVKVKPWLLFTCDEEIGGVGASDFCTDHGQNKLPKELANIKCLIEIDRKGSNDAVYYDCANTDFKSYITGKGFKTSYGTFSDISVVAPELHVAAVNLSSGYYNAHNLHEYIDKRDLNETIKKVCTIVNESVNVNFPTYEYIEAPRTYKYKGYNGYKDYGYYYDKWDYYDGWYHNKKKEKFDDPFDQIMYDELTEYYTVSELNSMITREGIGAIRRAYNEIFYGSADGSGKAWEIE